MEPQPSLATAMAPSRDFRSYVKTEPDSDKEEFGGGEIFDDIQDDYDIRKESAPVPPLSFSLSSLPSSSSPIVPFRWRGEGQAGGIIQLGDDLYPCSMTFSAGGAKCNGIFVSDNTDTVRFSGFKIDVLCRSPRKVRKRSGKLEAKRLTIVRAPNGGEDGMNLKNLAI